MMEGGGASKCQPYFVCETNRKSNRIMHFEFEFWGFGAPRYHLQGVGAPCHQEPLDPHQGRS